MSDSSSAPRDLMHLAETRQLVRDAYRAIGSPTSAGAVLYTEEQLARLPAGAQAWSLGVGNPVTRARLVPGEVVVDLGCGGGIDTILAAQAVAPDGRAIGLDLLPEMVERARANAVAAGTDNVEFVEGEMEAIPLPDASVDVVVSNGVVNLSARKTRVFYELARVLRPGGRVSLTDVIVDDDLPAEILVHPSAWAGWVSGALAERVFAEKLERVGLRGVTVVERRSWGIDDCARYPLFDGELLGLMRRLVPPGVHDRVATVLTFTASKPPTPDAARDGLVASSRIRNEEGAASVFPGRAGQPRRADVSEHGPPHHYDAGDLGCGDGLPREVRRRLSEIPEGATLQVTVRDPAAKADLPPLVRMLGHRLLSQEAHPDGRLVIEVERGT